MRGRRAVPNSHPHLVALFSGERIWCCANANRQRRLIEPSSTGWLAGWAPLGWPGPHTSDLPVLLSGGLVSSAVSKRRRCTGQARRVESGAPLPRRARIVFVNWGPHPRCSVPESCLQAVIGQLEGIDGVSNSRTSR